MSQKGNITVGIGQLISFSGSYSNLDNVINLVASINGRADETITQSRSRIAQGKVIENNIDGATRALKSLVGVNDARIYFNYDPVNTMTLPGGKEVPPRYARIFIYGSSDLIGETFANRLIVPTPDLDDAESQIFTTLSDQDVEIFYNSAETQNPWVKIYVPDGISLSDSQEGMIKDIVLSLDSYVTIGQLITQKLIDEKFKDFVEVEIIGSKVSATDSAYGSYLQIDGDKMPQFIVEQITIEAVS